MTLSFVRRTLVLSTWSLLFPWESQRCGRSWRLDREVRGWSTAAPPHPPKLFVGGRAQKGTMCNGKAGKCDQNPGLQPTGKMISPRKEALCEEPQNKDTGGLLGNQDEQCKPRGSFVPSNALFLQASLRLGLGCLSLLSTLDTACSAENRARESHCTKRI